MRIYNVIFSVDVDVEELKKIYKENNNGDELPEDVADDIETDDNDSDFQIGAHNLVEAYNLAEDYLDTVFADSSNTYEITGVTEFKNLNIINWPEPECPICLAEGSPPEDVIAFSCPKCKEEMKAVDNGWKTVMCHNCGKEIERECLVGSNGRYVFVNLEKKEK